MRWVGFCRPPAAEHWPIAERRATGSDGVLARGLLERFAPLSRRDARFQLRVAAFRVGGAPDCVASGWRPRNGSWRSTGRSPVVPVGNGAGVRAEVGDCEKSPLIEFCCPLLSVAGRAGRSCEEYRAPATWHFHCVHLHGSRRSAAWSSKTAGFASGFAQENRSTAMSRQKTRGDFNTHDIAPRVELFATCEHRALVSSHTFTFISSIWSAHESDQYGVCSQVLRGSPTVSPSAGSALTGKGGGTQDAALPRLCPPRLVHRRCSCVATTHRRQPLLVVHSRLIPFVSCRRRARCQPRPGWARPRRGAAGGPPRPRRVADGVGDQRDGYGRCASGGVAHGKAADDCHPRWHLPYVAAAAARLWRGVGVDGLWGSLHTFWVRKRQLLSPRTCLPF